LEIGIMTNAPSAEPDDLVGDIADRILESHVEHLSAPERPPAPMPAELDGYPVDLIGTFYSDELDTRFVSQAFARRATSNSIELAPRIRPRSRPRIAKGISGSFSNG